MAKAGQPTKYNDRILEQAEKLCVLGATDSDLADFFKVCEATINNWKHDHSKFLESIKRGKDKFDSEKIEGALRHRALGFDHDEEKVFCNMGHITTHNCTKHYPPDTTALIFWLKNRNPDRWRDRQEIDHQSSDGSMSPKATKNELKAELKELGIEC